MSLYLYGLYTLLALLRIINSKIDKMSSLKEKAKKLDRLVIDAGEFQEVVLEIRYNGIKVGEKIIAVSQLNWQTATGKSDVVLSFREIY